jgi:hypothetical protein
VNSILSGAVVAHVSRQFESNSLRLPPSTRWTRPAEAANSWNSSEQSPRTRDLGHLEAEGAYVTDDLRAALNRRWAVAHEIGA